MTEDQAMELADRLYDRHMMYTGAKAVGGTLLERMFSKEDPEIDPNVRILTRLQVIQKKRDMGLPVTSEEYADLLETDRTPPNYGRGITLGAVAMGSKKPLFNIPDERKILGGITHGFKNSRLGRVARLFG